MVQLIVSGLGPFPVGGAYEIILESPSHSETIEFDLLVDIHGASTLHEFVAGDWSDSNITIEDDGVVHAIGTNPMN